MTQSNLKESGNRPNRFPSLRRRQISNWLSSETILAAAAVLDSTKRHPSHFTYDDFIQYVPRGKKGQWHERAMTIATRGDIGDFMDLCVNTKEWARLVARVHAAPHSELEAVSHHHLEPAANGLKKRDVPAAAKLYRALGFRILISKKSKYYNAALSHFRRARDLYQKANLRSEWNAVVETIRVEHSRKSSFMPGFERILAGKKDSHPSFAQRTKARWARQMGKSSE